MAALKTKSAKPIASFEVPFGKYTLRSDGKILRQLRIDGRLEGATIVGQVHRGLAAGEAPLRNAFADYERGMRA